MVEQRFKATIIGCEDRAYFEVPFDPNEVWGEKERHYVTAFIGEYHSRSVLDTDRSPARYWLSPSWLRDREVVEGETVEVVLTPEEPQLDTMAPDIADAIRADPQAKAFFESLASFNRKNYVRWIEEAKRPETREKRLATLIGCSARGERLPQLVSAKKK
jgi:hypothetical protein